jgi:hypothetical protein
VLSAQPSTIPGPGWSSRALPLQAVGLYLYLLVHCWCIAYGSLSCCARLVQQAFLMLV